MAAIVITVADVLASTSPITVNKQSGGTLTQGKVVYVDSADNKAKLAKADAVATSSIYGVCLNAALANQPVTILTAGALNLTPSTVVIGESYYLSDATAGAIVPGSDLGIGDYISFLGIGTSISTINLAINNSGVAHA